MWRKKGGVTMTKKIKKAKKQLLDELLTLLNIYSPSGEEAAVADYVTAELQRLGFVVNKDTLGNVYATRGTAEKYPLLNAHMDSVGGYWYYKSYLSLSKGEKSCEKCLDFSLCYKGQDTYLSFKNRGLATVCEYYLPLDYGDADAVVVDEPAPTTPVAFFDKAKGLIVGDGSRPIGGDDKCGIAIALAAAREYSGPLKILFTVQEEIGCVGSSYFVKSKEGVDFLSNVRYNVTIDRRGQRDLVYKAAGTPLASPQFVGRVVAAAMRAEVVPKLVGEGLLTDAIALSSLVPEAVNLSAGYHRPHSCDEFVSIEDVWVIKNWVLRIFEECADL